MNLKEKIKNFDWKGHLVDNTAINAFAVPVCAYMETSRKICELMNKIPYVNVAPVSDEVSLKARLYAVGLGYLGLAFVLSKGRDISRKVFKIKETSKEKLHFIHDTLYLIGFNALVNPSLYYLSGSRDAKEIIGGTLALTVFSVFAGWSIGYTIDSFRDLAGLRTCKRKSYPDLIRKQPSKFKKGLATLLVAGSIAATAGVYALTPNKQDFNENNPVQKVESHYNNSVNSLEYDLSPTNKDF